MHTRSILTALSVVALVTGCSSEKKNDQFMQQLKSMAGNANSRNRGDTATNGDPCSLLDTTEVAAAVGPLARAPYRGEWKPEASANACRYDTKDHRRLLVSVDWSGGPAAMKMIRFGRGLTDQVSKQGETKVGKSVLANGDTLVGDWDEIAEGPLQCCDLHALRGDQHVELNWTGTRLTTTAAGQLLNAAVKRLDHPLAISGQAGLSAAQQALDAEAKDSMVDMCALVPQADAEAVLGAHLASPPERGPQPGAAGARACTYHVTTPAGQPPRDFELTLWEWHDGAVQFAEDQFAFGMAGHAMRRQATGDTTTPPVDSTRHPPGPWDEAGLSNGMGYEAVKGPVMVRVGAFGDSKVALALLGKAVTALKISN